MSALARRRSPLAHDVLTRCPSCVDCSSCDGGSAALPKTYRLAQRGDLFVAVCTRCDGTGTACLNLAKEPTP